MDNGAISYSRFLEGDRQSFTELVKEYWDGLTLYLTGFVESFPEAEEIAEETFLKLYTDKPKFSGKSLFKTWLYGIGRNTALYHLRKKRKIKETNIDILELTARQLGIQDRYVGGWWYLYLRFGEKEHGRKAPMCYTLYFTHGYGGGTTIGAKANKLTKLSGVIVADVIAMSHLHQKLKTEDAIYLPEYGNKVVKKKEIHYVMNNSFLDYGGYGEEMGLKPTTKSLTKITLNGRKREID